LASLKPADVVNILTVTFKIMSKQKCKHSLHKTLSL